MMEERRETDYEPRRSPTYHVIPNAKFIEQSTRYYSRLFTSTNYCAALQQLSEGIYRHYIENLETKEEYLSKMAFIDVMENLIKRRSKWPFKLYPSGSTMTGLASKGSDLDVTLWCPAASRFFPNEADAAFHILHWVRHYLLTNDKMMRDINNVQYVEAKVPVLRIKSMNGLEIDFCSCTDNYVSGIQNSYLIRGFVSWDRRVGPLCMLVKDWAGCNDVKNPKLGGFNSYAMVLLVIHFLQCGVSPPILPNLQKLFPDKYARNVSGMIEYPMTLHFEQEDLSRVDFDAEENTLNLAQLFILFLDYYSRFEFRTHYICMRDAAVKFRNGRDGSSPISDVFSVYIRDPIDDHNPGRTVRDITDLQTKMRNALELFAPSRKFPTLTDLLTPL